MYDPEQLSKFKLVDPRGLTLSYKFAPNVVETLAPSCPLTGVQDPEKERQKIDAVKNYSFIRLPATSFLSWLRHQGPEELEKAKKAESNLKRNGPWGVGSAPPKRVRKRPLFTTSTTTTTAPPLEGVVGEEEAETDEYDTE